MPPPPINSGGYRNLSAVGTVNRSVGSVVSGLYPLLNLHDLVTFAAPSANLNAYNFQWERVSEITPEGLFLHPLTFSGYQIPDALCDAFRFLYRFKEIRVREDTRRTAAALLASSQLDGTSRARIARGLANTDLDPELADTVAAALVCGYESNYSTYFSRVPALGSYIGDVPALVALLRDEMQEPDLLHIAVKNFVRPQHFREIVHEIRDAFDTFSDEDGPYVPIIESMFDGVKLEIARYWMR